MIRLFQLNRIVYILLLTTLTTVISESYSRKYEKLANIVDHEC